MILNEKEKYIDLDNSEIRNAADKIIDLWQGFLLINDDSLKLNKDYTINERNLFEVIKRTDKRRVYYHVFHKISYDEVCEYKEMAISAYWINTLKPFMVIKKESPLYNCSNEMFSLYLILTLLNEVYKKYNNGKSIPSLPEQKITDYVYYFKYCDVSREAMIQFVDMLASIYGIGTEIVLPNQCRNE